jgi:hypothetical protein
MNATAPRRIDRPVKSKLLFAVAALGCAGAPEPDAPVQPVEPGFVVENDASLEQACAALPRADSLMCRADRRLMAARSRGDATLVGCLAKGGRELRATLRWVGESRDQAAAAARAGNAADERAKLAHAERALEQQYARLDDCPGSRAVVAADSVRVVRPVLAETDDYPR